MHDRITMKLQIFVKIKNGKNRLNHVEYYLLKHIQITRLHIFETIQSQSFSVLKIQKSTHD